MNIDDLAEKMANATCGQDEESWRYMSEVERNTWRAAAKVALAELTDVIAGGETMSLKKTPGQVAYEAAAAATSCTQSWEESNKAKWEAAATAVLDGQPSLEEWKVIDDFLSTHWMAFVTECKSAGIDPDVLSFKLEDAASGKLTWGDCQACNETSVVNHGKCQCCGAIHGH